LVVGMLASLAIAPHVKGQTMPVVLWIVSAILGEWLFTAAALQKRCTLRGALPVVVPIKGLPLHCTSVPGNGAVVDLSNCSLRRSWRKLGLQGWRCCWVVWGFHLLVGGALAELCRCSLLCVVLCGVSSAALRLWHWQERDEARRNAAASFLLRGHDSPGLTAKELEEGDSKGARSLADYLCEPRMTQKSRLLPRGLYHSTPGRLYARSDASTTASSANSGPFASLA